MLKAQGFRPGFWGDRVAQQLAHWMYDAMYNKFTQVCEKGFHQVDAVAVGSAGCYGVANGTVGPSIRYGCSLHGPHVLLCEACQAVHAVLYVSEYVCDTNDAICNLISGCQPSW
jgi:hypothetical protein